MPAHCSECPGSGDDYSPKRVESDVVNRAANMLLTIVLSFFPLVILTEYEVESTIVKEKSSLKDSRTGDNGKNKN